MVRAAACASPCGTSDDRVVQQEPQRVAARSPLCLQTGRENTRRTTLRYFMSGGQVTAPAHRAPMADFRTVDLMKSLETGTLGRPAALALTAASLRDTRRAASRAWLVIWAPLPRRHDAARRSRHHPAGPTPLHQRRSPRGGAPAQRAGRGGRDRKSTRLNSSHVEISYAVFC